LRADCHFARGTRELILQRRELAMSPSIAQQVADREQSLSQRAAKGDFFKLGLLMMKHGGVVGAREHAKVERASERVQSILKSAVTGIGLETLADYQNIQAAFAESLRSLSVFDAVLDGGMVRAPLRSKGFSITTGITGAVVGERAFKPISSVVLAQQLLEPKKASAIVIVSKELANFPGSQQLFADELTRGVVAATDVSFLAALLQATTPTASAGATLANITTDFDTLFSAVTTHATSRLFYVASPSNVKSIMVKANTAGAPVFPNLGVTGGELFPGVTAIASDALTGTALLFDSTSIAGNADVIVPGRSEQSAIQMETAPDSPPTGATTVISLWQNDLVALRMERFFGFTIMRPSGVASLSGVNY
jgi:hypothetical protein